MSDSATISSGRAHLHWECESSNGADGVLRCVMTEGARGCSRPENWPLKLFGIFVFCILSTFFVAQLIHNGPRVNRGVIIVSRGHSCFGCLLPIAAALIFFSSPSLILFGFSATPSFGKQALNLRVPEQSDLLVGQCTSCAILVVSQILRLSTHGWADRLGVTDFDNRYILIGKVLEMELLRFSYLVLHRLAMTIIPKVP